MLPKITLPTFFVELISTGKKHKFHPYTSKQQEILLISLEGENKDEIINACEDLLNDCVEDIDAKTLPIFDFECLFLKLRIASSGEIITLSVPHLNNPDCDHKQKIDLNLNDIKIRQCPNHSKTFDLSDTIGVTMKYPTMADSTTSSSKDLLLKCIESIYDADNVYLAKDFSKEELEDWVGSLENKHINKIKDFFDTMPKVFFEIKYKCNKCGVEETRIIEGFENFFITP